MGDNRIGMKYFVRSALIGALPFILAWAFCSTLIREVKGAFWYAWQEVRIECDSFRKLWERAA